MKSIKICVGSACHIKGSYDVIDIFNELISEYNLDSKVELKASFCLGRCTDAVSILRWDEKVLSANKNNAKYIFEKEILPYI